MSTSSGTRGAGEMLVLGALHISDEVIGGGIRVGGELQYGSSWSRACGSSKDFLNFDGGGGENDPRTEFIKDMLNRSREW